MATGLPFCPSNAATTGRTAMLTTASGPSQNMPMNFATFPANNLLIQADKANADTCFVRISAEISTLGGTTPLAVAPTTGSPGTAGTLGDLPLAPGASMMIQNPVPNGAIGVAVMSAAAATIYITPGEGGAPK